MRAILKKVSLFIITNLVLISSSFASAIGDYFRNNKTNPLDPKTLRNSIVDILCIIGYAVAGIIILATAIQFFTANSQKRALLKEKLWLILAGVFIIGAGVPLLNAIITIVLDLRGDMVTDLGV